MQNGVDEEEFDGFTGKHVFNQGASAVARDGKLPAFEFLRMSFYCETKRFLLN
jgi:hypothetical protein